MKKLPSIHPVLELKGSPRRCGRDYGESQAEAIEAFLYMEVTPNPKRLRYAAKCWDHLKRWEKPVVEFVRGMAEGSKLSVEQTTLVLLHEEIVHMKPCTAIGATGQGTRDGKPIIGQNWDWNAPLYPWPSLLRLRTDATPAAIYYAYPGLWASAGMNEYGMSLVWTGSGYLPKVAPKVGVPTYALIAGILACRDCQQALRLLQRTPVAGCFIFFIADAKGEIWVIEGLPGRTQPVRCEDVVTRANHYECPDVARLARQQIDPPINPLANTQYRGPRMAELGRRYRGRIDRHVIEKCLCDGAAGPGKAICQRPTSTRRGMTIDSFYCLPSQREFWIARGIPSRHEFKRYRV